VTSTINYGVDVTVGCTYQVDSCAEVRKCRVATEVAGVSADGSSLGGKYAMCCEVYACKRCVPLHS
jgi:hypothetical protein